MPKSKEKLEEEYYKLEEMMKGKDCRGVLDLVEFLRIRNFKAQVPAETDEKLIKEKTQKAIEIAKCENPEEIKDPKEIKEALRLLCELEGVEVPIASAILHFAYPDNYAIMDRYCWLRAIKEAEGRNLNKNYGTKKKARENYIIYLEIIKRCKRKNERLRDIEKRWFDEGRKAKK